LAGDSLPDEKKNIPTYNFPIQTPTITAAPIQSNAFSTPHRRPVCPVPHLTIVPPANESSGWKRYLVQLMNNRKNFWMCFFIFPPEILFFI
jgi:hypothetical protein